MIASHRWIHAAQLAADLVAGEPLPRPILGLCRIAAQFRARAASVSCQRQDRTRIPASDWAWITAKLLRADCRGGPLPVDPPAAAVNLYWRAYDEIRAMEDRASGCTSRREQLARARAGQRAAAIGGEP